MSFATRPIAAAKTAVNPPMRATVFMAVALSSNSPNSRATRKTPAATIVAAWMSELTGVGPSIASGSHVWRGNCADLPTAPAKSPRATHVATPAERAGAASRIAGISNGFRPSSRNAVRLKYRYMMPRRKPKSPTRVTMNAFLAAAAAAGRWLQNPMSR